MSVLVSSLKVFMSSIKKKNAVVGLSGGIDSALVLKIAVLALGKENVTAIFMPESGLTSQENKEDAMMLAYGLGVKLEIVPIDDFLKAVSFPWDQTRLSFMNLKPRIRMMILYNFANANDAIVLGTSNKSEIMLGYGTKFGDTASDVLPIGSLYKTDVFALAERLGLPKNIVLKKPSAELYEGQSDEEELGITYERADLILKAIEEGNYLEGFDQNDVSLIKKRMEENRHKNSFPPVLR